MSIAFLKEFIRDPIHLGAVAPSSPRLARTTVGSAGAVATGVSAAGAAGTVIAASSTPNQVAAESALSVDSSAMVVFCHAGRCGVTGLAAPGDTNGATASVGAGVTSSPLPTSSVTGKSPREGPARRWDSSTTASIGPAPSESPSPAASAGSRGPGENGESSATPSFCRDIHRIGRRGPELHQALRKQGPTRVLP